MASTVGRAAGVANEKGVGERRFWDVDDPFTDHQVARSANGRARTSARGGTRTHTRYYPHRLLGPTRIPDFATRARVSMLPALLAPMDSLTIGPARSWGLVLSPSRDVRSAGR